MKTITKVILKSFIITSFIFIICHILNINHIFVSSGPFESYGLFGGRWYMSTGGVAGPGSCLIFTKYNTLHYNIIKVIIKFIIIMLLSCFTQYLYIRKLTKKKLIFIHCLLVLNIGLFIYSYIESYTELYKIFNISNNVITNYILTYRYVIFMIISILSYDIYILFQKYKQL